MSFHVKLFHISKYQFNWLMSNARNIVFQCCVFKNFFKDKEGRISADTYLFLSFKDISNWHLDSYLASPLCYVMILQPQAFHICQLIQSTSIVLLYLI